MTGLDTLIAKALKDIVKNNLGDVTYNEIEKRLFERYDVGFTQTTEDFGKLDSILKEFYGDDTAEIEKQIISKIIILDQTECHEKKWVTLEDSGLIELLLKSLGDYDKKNIMNTVMNEPMMISEILEISKISHTSCYRKVNALIDDGILIP